jgi:glutathione S-transferase
VYESRLKKSGSGFLMPNGLTFVDFFAADWLHTIEKHEPKIVGGYPDLLAYVSRVYNSKKEVREHVNGRKEGLL